MAKHARRNRRNKQKKGPGDVPPRQAVLKFLEKAGRPRTLDHIADGLSVPGGDARGALSRLLDAMLRDGQIIRNRRDGYGLVARMGLVPGRVIGHPDGYGFVVPDDQSGDLFLPAKEMRTVLHGDRVVARVAGTDRQGRREGAIVEVTGRANARIVGRFVMETGIGVLVPDNRRIHQDILIPKESRGAVRTGQFAVAEIVSQPSRHAQPVGRIIEVLGDHTDPGMASEIALRAFELPHAWPEAVSDEAAVLDVDAALPVRGRTDFRGLPFVTIDGEDARDFDDAVFCEERGGGWRLVVAIADVSHYVRPGSALDAEARLRGNSVYFVDRVVPMLPEVLSNELCSLKPGVDRLVLACDMEISAKGKVRRSRFVEGVIHSAARLTYTEVGRIAVDRDAAARRDRPELLDPLDRLYTLFRLMHRRRRKDGVLDFDSTESRVEFDEAGRIRAIHELVRNDAHRMIEEFMLAANVAAAELLLERRQVGLFRNHERPRPEKVEALREFLAETGLDLGGGEEPTTRDYARLREAAQERPDVHLIQIIMLRSMPLAVYGAENVGHFGLAFKAYTHFTSPIRRYPDLVVHRAIRHLISRRTPFPYGQNDLSLLAEHCSMTERRADEATRDALQRLKCEFMQDKVGQVFEGTITGVTGFGLFVELDDIFVEGLVHVTSLPNDYYRFDPVRHQLRGDRRGLQFRLAGRITVRVVRVDVDEKKVDFSLQHEESGRESGQSRGGKRGAGRKRRH